MVLKDDFFPEDHATDTVGGGGYFVAIKRLDILVTHRAVVVALVFVQTQVESGPMLYDTTIERREQHMVFVVEFRHGNHKQTVVFARVAVYY